MRLPPSSSSALGSPPMRMLRPPAWMTPVILTERLSLSSFGAVGCGSHCGPTTSCGSHYHCALSDHARGVDGDVDHCRGRAAGRRPAVEHEVERVAEVGEDGAGGRGR